MSKNADKYWERVKQGCCGKCARIMPKNDKHKTCSFCREKCKQSQGYKGKKYKMIDRYRAKKLDF